MFLCASKGWLPSTACRSTCQRGFIFGLVGPNGAGKTCLLNVVSGVFPQSEGQVYFDGREISDIPLYQRVDVGIGRTFQGVELIAELVGP